MVNEVAAWRFTGVDRRLWHGDDRIAEPGVTLWAPGYDPAETWLLPRQPIKLYTFGMHGGKRVIDALGSMPEGVLCRVTLFNVVQGDDYIVAAEGLRVEWYIDTLALMPAFARWCADRAADHAVAFKRDTGDEPVRDYAAKAPRYAARFVTLARRERAIADRAAARAAAARTPRGAAYHDGRAASAIRQASYFSTYAASIAASTATAAANTHASDYTRAVRIADVAARNAGYTADAVAAREAAIQAHLHSDAHVSERQAQEAWWAAEIERLVQN